MRRGFIALSTFLAGILGGGGGSTTSPPPPPPPPAPAVGSVALSATAGMLVPNQTLQLTATLRDAQGNTLSGRPISWSSSAPEIFVGATGGSLSALSGNVRLTVPAGGVSSGTAITVTAATGVPADVRVIMSRAATRGRLERVVGTLPAHFALRNRVELVVDQRDQPDHRRFVSARQVVQQPGDFVRRGGLGHRERLDSGLEVIPNGAHRALNLVHRVVEVG